MNPLFSITFSKCSSNTVNENTTEGFLVHVQVWRLVWETWVTWETKRWRTK